uniref:Lid2 complex component lid2 n=1 Tax=Ganoderma boninense TaxID=34458 RepID=A0A5K1JUS7_9APHY|nr:Lid2 complex component lid2 [Ganoderma boninense]
MLLALILLLNCIDSYVDPLPSGYHYATPLNTTASANPCRCNTVLFSTIAACATCQGGEDFIVPWFLYSQNCSTIYIQKYPEDIPSGTAIPAWAYLDVRINSTFDPAAAKAVALQNLPESSAPPAPSTTQTSESGASTPISPNATTTDGAAASGTSPATGDTARSGSEKKSNAGPIAGGIIGGVTGFVLVGLAVSYVVRRRARRNTVAGSTLEHTDYGIEVQSWEKSPVTPASTHKLYDPNDPTTFPTQDPYGSGLVPVTSGYLTADTSAGAFGSSFSADGHRGGGATTQNPYRGAPEL